jgi:aminoglycoside phosphotransferase (APT) family kinase protein
MIDRICSWLRDRAPAELHQLPCGGVVVAIDRDPCAKVTMLLFDEQGRPCAIVKTTRNAQSEAALSAEYAALGRLASLPAFDLRLQVPLPVALDRVDGRLVLVATVLTGSPLTAKYYRPGHVTRPAAVRQDFVVAADWLATLQTQTMSASSTLRASLLSLAERAARRFRQQVGWTGRDAAAFAELNADIRALPSAPVSLCIVHGDYAIGNLLTDPHGITGVIDWELSEARGLAIKDVFKFAASYSSFLDRAEPPRHGHMRGHPGWEAAAARWPARAGWTNLTGFMYGFFGEGWYPDLVRDFVTSSADRVGVPRCALPVLLRAFVLEQASVLADPVYCDGYRHLHDAIRDVSVGGRVLVEHR